MGNTQQLVEDDLTYTKTTILQHYFSKRAFATVAKCLKSPVIYTLNYTSTLLPFLPAQTVHKARYHPSPLSIRRRTLATFSQNTFKTRTFTYYIRPSHQEFRIRHCNCYPFPFYQQSRNLDLKSRKHIVTNLELTGLGKASLTLELIRTHSISAIASHSRTSSSS